MKKKLFISQFLADVGVSVPIFLLLPCAIAMLQIFGLFPLEHHSEFVLSFRS